ncbi:entericidin A/B family lipoprotein [Piscinibacter sp.]|nr:entericidin A/B family lipoprotein [Albitalea sp.]HUG23302.1 entericidin A/B family lipoprotein [Albitalea sp.]
MIKNLRSLLTIAAAAFALSACNTMDGLGKDIQKAGQSLEDAANKKK